MIHWQVISFFLLKKGGLGSFSPSSDPPDIQQMLRLKTAAAEKLVCIVAQTFA